jgi:putative hydroxymethylpyrimidine transport system permease protein
MSRRAAPLASVLLLAAAIAGWELAVRLADVPRYLLPAPSDIARALADHRGRLAEDALVTGAEMVAGFALALAAGLAAAIALHASPALRRAAYPLLVASQSVPVVAIAPILVLYLGYGLSPKLVIVALLCFFPIVVATVDGLRAVDPALVVAMRTLWAGRLAIFRRVELPAALPHVFSGARVAAAYAAVAAMFAEYAGSERGLGVAMRNGTDRFDAALTGAAIVALAALSLLLFGAVTLVERIALPWTRDRGPTGG